MERWKIIEGTCGKYEVSTLGNVRCNNYRHTKNQKNLKLYRLKNGYLKCAYYIEGDRIEELVHRLVLTAFSKTPLNYKNLQVNHINGIKTDNNIDNLEWVTASENQRHSYKAGLQTQKGEQNNASKLTAEEVREVKALLKKGVAQKDVAKKFKVSRSNINLIAKEVTWQHITV